MAEGVESGSQRKIVNGLGFGQMQEFLSGKAVPAEEFLALLKERGICWSESVRIDPV